MRLRTGARERYSSCRDRRLGYLVAAFRRIRNPAPAYRDGNRRLHFVQFFGAWIPFTTLEETVITYEWWAKDGKGTSIVFGLRRKRQRPFRYPPHRLFGVDGGAGCRIQPRGHRQWCEFTDESQFTPWGGCGISATARPAWNATPPIPMLLPVCTG